MRILCVALMSCFCVTCGSNSEKHKVDDESTTTIIKPILDSILKECVLETVEFTCKWTEYNFPPPPISEGCLVMVFDINPEMKRMYFSDSTVYISHKVCGRNYSLAAYKGILSINNYYVAVFDEFGIGGQYYNTDSLKMLPFDGFKCFPMKIAPQALYYIKNNSLHYWNP